MFGFRRVREKIISIILLFFLLLSNFFSFLTPVFAASSPWSQTDWSGGSGQTSWSATNQYSSGSSVTTSTANQITLTQNSEKFSNTGFETNLTGWDTGIQPDSVSGLQAWFKADSITSLNDSDPVSTWSDSSTNARDATSASTNRPLYKTSIINSKPVVRFDGTDDYMSGAFLNGLNGASGFTVYAVWAAADNITERYFLQKNSQSDFRMTTGTDSLAIGLTTSAFTIFRPTMTHSYNAGQMATYLYDGANEYVYQAGTSRGTPPAKTGTVANGSGSSYMGSQGGTTGFLQGDIAELIIYNSGLSNANRSRIENYLRDKYNITVASGITSTTRDTTTKFAGNGSAKLVTAASDTGEFTQLVNVGDTSSYNLSAYAYTNGSAVTSSDVQLFYNGSTVSTTYTSAGGGWYQLTGSVTGANASRQYGVQVQANKTVYVDNMSLSNYPSSGTLTSSIFDTGQGSNFGTLTYSATTPTNTTATVKIRTSNDSAMSGATAFSSCTAISSGSTVGGTTCATNGQRYVQYLVTLATSDNLSTPTFTSFSLAFTVSDATAPTISLNSVSSPTTNTKPPVTGTATEETGTVSTVQFQMDSTSGSWTACTATDGSFNAASETFTCTPTSTLSDGSHTMYVRATDSNGNTTSSSNYSTATFTVDTTAPVNFSLDSPADNAYTTSLHPTFKWHPDGTESLAKYKLDIDNGDSGDFTIDNIPVSGISDVETSKYVVHYENFSDTDTTNNYISIYTKESSSWTSGENYGKLKDGKIYWRITAVDNAGNTKDSTRALNVDTSSPTLTLQKLGNQIFNTNITDWYHTAKTLTLIGKSSEKGSVSATFEKKGYNVPFVFGTFITARITTDDSGNFSWTTDNLEYGDYHVKIKATDQAGNSSSELLFNLYVESYEDFVAKGIFKTTPSVPTPTVIPGGKISNSPTPTLTIPTIIPTAKPTEKLSQGPSIIQKIIDSTGNIIDSTFEAITFGVNTTTTGVGNLLTSTSNAAGSILLAIGNGANAIINSAPGALRTVFVANETITKNIATTIINSENKKKEKLIALYEQPYDQFAKVNKAFKTIATTTNQPIEKTGNFFNRLKTGFDTFNTIVFDKNPTYITNVKIEEVGKDYAIVSWQTNHNAWGKVNYGTSTSYGKEVLLLKQEKIHRAKLTGLKSNEKYYFEVMSQGNNYTYDAYYTFTTKGP